ncbi:DUF4169 family protein [Marinovum sp.]|uniref:DUF4169 family protein n=1 Tax=Marinovum sp. TaxID=2024839 RepID=UPI002B266268|nr:DUF4169 family protein [Marinovum sp.]
MARIINLNQQRKQQARQKKAAHGSENAVKFGRSAAQKRAEAEAAMRQRRLLDQAEIDRPEAETPCSGSNVDTDSP